MSVLIQTIPMLPRSHNNSRGTHWAVLRREKHDWVRMVKNCPQAHRQTPGTKRRVEITFVKRSGPLDSDSDNLYARCKVVLDALVFRNWIIDDSPQFIELVPREDRGPTSTVIAVSEIVVEAA